MCSRFAARDFALASICIIARNNGLVIHLSGKKGHYMRGTRKVGAFVISVGVLLAISSAKLRGESLTASGVAYTQFFDGGTVNGNLQSTTGLGTMLPTDWKFAEVGT